MVKFFRQVRWWLAGLVLAGALIAGGAKLYRVLHPPPMYDHRPVEQWVRNLGDANYHTAHEAQTTIPSIGAAATPYLIQLIENPESRFDSFRNSLARRFAWLKLKPYDFQRARSSAVQLLGQVAPGDPAAVPALIRVLNDKDQNLALSAKETLTQAGHVAVMPLAKALKQPEPTVRYLAASALADMGPDTAEAVPMMLDALTDNVPEIRSALVIALARSGAPVSEFLPALISLFRDSAVTVRLDAINAVAAFQAEAAPATLPLTGQLKDAEQWVRSSAAFALGQIGSKAREAVPALQAALKDSSPHVRISAASALWKITDKSEGLPPIFAAALKESDSRIRNYAAQGLLQLGPVAYPYIPDIFTSLKSEFEPGRYHSALRLLGEGDERVMKYLAPELTSTDARERGGAVFVLGHLATRYPAALPPLREALHDKDAEVREAAERALKNLKLDGSTGGS